MLHQGSQHEGIRPDCPPVRVNAPAFTLVELLTVMTIIALLSAILLPVLGQVRRSARRQQVAGQLANLGMAIDAYHTQFSAYPGPVPDQPAGNLGSTIDGYEGSDDGTVSACENLVFGLLGCVAHDSDTTERHFTAAGLSRYVDDPPTQLVDGPCARVPHEDDFKPPKVAPRRLAPFYSPAERELGDLDGDERPEIVDLAQERRPILYYRARKFSQVLYVDDNDNDFKRSAHDFRQNWDYQDWAAPNHKRLVAQVWDWRSTESPDVVNEDTGQLEEELKFSGVPNFALGSSGEPALRPDSYVLIAAGDDGMYANTEESGADADGYLRPEDNDVTNVEKDNITNLR